MCGDGDGVVLCMFFSCDEFCCGALVWFGVANTFKRDFNGSAPGAVYVVDMFAILEQCRAFV